MRHALVTGVAGFVGSTLAERLCADGVVVTGIDAFTDYYARTIKERNLERLRPTDSFRLIEGDLVDLDLAGLFSDSVRGDRSGAFGPIDTIFHLAGQPGVRGSWGSRFDEYARNNILATQRLLEAAKGHPLRKLVYASSSSIYGNSTRLPTSEDETPHPISPYGVTKLAAEHLALLYHHAFGLPVNCVRFFTVYGPRQRPDMAFRKFIEAVERGKPIVVYGNGEQTRDFTYVTDAVDGISKAASTDVNGMVFNIGGGSRVSVNEVLRTLEDVTGHAVLVDYAGPQDGDVVDTSADIQRANQLLGYLPRTSVRDGLRAEVDWFRASQRSIAVGSR